MDSEEDTDGMESFRRSQGPYYRTGCRIIIVLNAVLITLFILTFTTMIQVTCHHTEGFGTSLPKMCPFGIWTILS